MRLVLDCLGRLARRPATWVSYGLVLGLMVFVFVVIGATANSLPDSAGGGRAALSLLTYPGAYDSVLAFLIGIGTLLAVVYGGAVAGSEWSWGTLKNAVARGESRAGYVTALFAAARHRARRGACRGDGHRGHRRRRRRHDGRAVDHGPRRRDVLGRTAGEVGARLAGASSRRRLSASPSPPWRAAQLAGIGVGIATYFAEQFSTIFFPDIVKFLPFHAAEAVVNLSQSGSVGVGNGGAEAAARLAPDVALVVVLCWLVGALLVGALVTRRADITG